MSDVAPGPRFGQGRPCMEASKKSKELLTRYKIKYLHLTLLQVIFVYYVKIQINVLLVNTMSDNEAICMKCYNRAVAQLQSPVI